MESEERVKKAVAERETLVEVLRTKQGQEEEEALATYNSPAGSFRR